MRGQDNTLELAQGVRVGQYTLTELLGRGATGEVWSAHSSADQQDYALKFLRAHLVGDLNQREAFRKEANLAIRLRSPQLVRVLRYDVTPSERPFIVMELLQGEDLDALLRREGQMSLRDALLVAIELLKGLSELHALDLVHRDLKPGNVFLLRSKGVNGEPRAKMIDFGHMTLSAHQPTTGALEGTYLYMAPEQLRRKPVSAAADIYSLGALLFTMIAGRPPFLITGGDKPYAHLDQPIPSLTDRVPHAPQALSRLISLCLDPDPARRPESADALRRTLEHTLDELARPVSPEDGLLPAEDDAPPSGVWDEGARREAQEAHTLDVLLRTRGDELAEVWTQAITERPAFSRLQPHLLKQSAKSYLALIAQVAGGRNAQLFTPLAERVAQATSHMSVDLAPLLNASLLRPALHVCAPYEWTEEAIQGAQSALFAVLYALHQRVIEAIVTRYPADAEVQLKRLFAQGSELMALSTLSGVLLHTQPGLRSVFGEVDDSHLRQRGLFELLNGYQPLMPLQRAFKELPQVPFSGVFSLQNPKARGTATRLKVGAHLFERVEQRFVLIFFEVLEERSMQEAGVELSDEFDAPQSLPWVETREISALSPVEQRELFGFVPQDTYGEDEPTPIPNEGALPSPELDFSSPSALSRAPQPPRPSERPQSLSAPVGSQGTPRLVDLQELEQQLRERERALLERERSERERSERERYEREQARYEQLEREREQARYEQLEREREQARYEQLEREREREQARYEQQLAQAHSVEGQGWQQAATYSAGQVLPQASGLSAGFSDISGFAISQPPRALSSSNDHFHRPSEKPISNRPEPRSQQPGSALYTTGSYDNLSKQGPSSAARPSPSVSRVPPSSPSRPAAPSPSRASSPSLSVSAAYAASPAAVSSVVPPPPRPSQPSPIRLGTSQPVQLSIEEPELQTVERAIERGVSQGAAASGARGEGRVKERALDPGRFGTQLMIFVAIASLAFIQRDALRDLLSPAPPPPEPLIPAVSAPPLPAHLVAPEPLAAMSRVRLVVPVGQVNFFKMIDGAPVELCKGVSECDVNAEDEVLILSPNHYPRSIMPDELKAKRGEEWALQLIPKEQGPKAGLEPKPRAQ